MSTQKGFTLIELIVVFALITLAVTIINSSLGDYKMKGSDTGRIAALQQTRSALNDYFNDSAGGNGRYPVGNSTALRNALVPKYIRSIDANVLYLGTNMTYHLAIPLSKIDNLVLKSDKDAIDGTIDGTKDNCISGTASNPDLCYDLTQ